jgi:hypothetical protein
LIESGGPWRAIGRGGEAATARTVCAGLRWVPHDIKRIAGPIRIWRGAKPSPTRWKTGDGINMAEALGATVDIRFKDAAAWMPVSRVIYANGEVGVFPHLLDRYKPGIIGVLSDGKRFTNESNSYHDVGAAMIRACAGRKDTAWLVATSHAGWYGIGFVSRPLCRWAFSATAT